MAADPCRERRAAVAADLAERGLDGLLLATGANLRYLSGFTGSNAMLLVAAGGEAILFTDPRYRIQAHAEVSCRTRVASGPLTPEVVKAVAKLRIRKLGFERARFSYDGYDQLRSRLPLKTALEPVAGVVEARRMVKSAAEIALIRQSMEIAVKAFEQSIRHARAGMREFDLAAEIDHHMRRLGAEKPSFETIVAAGARSALPHASPTAARLEPGALVLIDMGAQLEGYASDMTRMLSCGPPPAKARKLYRAVIEAQQAALAAVRAGVSSAHPDRAARRVLRAHGLERAFVHSTGHGLGLEIHEAPRLGRREKIRLQAGMTVTVEPGAYLEGYGGVRIEDTVVVTQTGCEILTRSSKELRVV
ncbi:MAG: M24 family metallopeptidase [Bryobacteraceae bacterium]